MANLYQQHNKIKFAVAPMLDWTDRHCRFFHRQLTRQTLLYSEMIVADAAIHGDRQRLLRFNEIEHPIALQLGGSDADKLAEAAHIGADFGYDEINLNVGCPSNRVQSGAFGACLMREPATVARAIEAMKKAVTIPVTVKCRIGVDDQDSEAALDTLGHHLVTAGVDAVWIHARKAWLQGLSPKENRDIPPLDYNRVYRFKQRFSHLFVGINGGITTLDQAKHHLEHVDAVMIGRAAYHNPLLLTELEQLSRKCEAVFETKNYGEKQELEHSVEPNETKSALDPTALELDYHKLIETMAAYAQVHISTGGRLISITRHMVGLFHGFKGAKRWRQILSNEGAKSDADHEILSHAFAHIEI